MLGVQQALTYSVTYRCSTLEMPSKMLPLEGSRGACTPNKVIVRELCPHHIDPESWN
jgi:hypothetical protein